MTKMPQVLSSRMSRPSKTKRVLPWVTSRGRVRVASRGRGRGRVRVRVRVRVGPRVRGADLGDGREEG